MFSCRKSHVGPSSSWSEEKVLTILPEQEKSLNIKGL